MYEWLFELVAISRCIYLDVAVIQFIIPLNGWESTNKSTLFLAGLFLTVMNHNPINLSNLLLWQKHWFCEFDKLFRPPKLPHLIRTPYDVTNTTTINMFVIVSAQCTFKHETQKKTDNLSLFKSGKKQTLFTFEYFLSQEQQTPL